MRIGVDLMGSDVSPLVLFEAVLLAAEQLDPSHTLVAIATHSSAEDIQRRYHAALSAIPFARIILHPVSDSITMHDEPVQAVSRKKESSIVVGIHLLKMGIIDAFISCGNTGALIASATLQLPLLPGIKRPALLVLLPTHKGLVAVLDVGGNVSCKSHHLVQFAYMGAAYQSCYGIECPRIGLLNIGVEPKKGTSTTCKAYQILKEKCENTKFQMEFLGNVESRDLFKGGMDVLVTDGFTGNVLLKTTEGVASFIFNYLEKNLHEASLSDVKQKVKDLKHLFSDTEYPGATVCGVEGLVIKCHGRGSVKGLLNGIKGAVHLHDKQLISKLKSQLAHLQSI